MAFQQLSSDGGKTINEDNLTKVAQLIIPDLNIIKRIFSKVDASGLGEATQKDFINFLPKSTVPYISIFFSAEFLAIFSNNPGKPNIWSPWS